MIIWRETKYIADDKFQYRDRIARWINVQFYVQPMPFKLPDTFGPSTLSNTLPSLKGRSLSSLTRDSHTICYSQV